LSSMNTSSNVSDRVTATLPRHEVERPLRSSASVNSSPTELTHTPVRIIVADSEAIFRVGMGKIFALEKDLEVVAQTETLQQTLVITQSV